MLALKSDKSVFTVYMYACVIRDFLYSNLGRITGDPYYIFPLFSSVFSD